MTAEEPQVTEAPQESDPYGGQLVWISETGSKYHNKNNCGRMNPDRAYQMTRENAEARGMNPAKNVFKREIETPQPDRAGNPSGCGVFLCFFLHKNSDRTKSRPAKRRRFWMRKKKKQKKSLHPPGGELLSAMQVPSDLAFGEPVVTFYGGREVQIENYRRILEYNACRLCVLTQYGRLLLVGEGIRIVSYSGEEMRVEGRIDQVTFQ